MNVTFFTITWQEDGRYKIDSGKGKNAKKGKNVK